MYIICESTVVARWSCPDIMHDMCYPRLFFANSTLRTQTDCWASDPIPGVYQNVYLENTKFLKTELWMDRFQSAYHPPSSLIKTNTVN